MKKLNNKTILIIDDDVGVVRALSKVLTGEGAKVIPAVWGGEAMETLTARQERIDLVITDLRLPAMTGITVVFAVHEVFPELPVIVLTAYGSPDVKDECIRQGAVAFLEKPLDTEQLLEAVEDAFALQEAGS